jgi:hypothetical protein
MPVVYMPPSTDPLDGLNKPVPEEALQTYRNYFDELMKSSTGQVRFTLVEQSHPTSHQTYSKWTGNVVISFKLRALILAKVSQI